MVAQAVAIMRRKTSGRMPPWRRYSASAGESTRASTSKRVDSPADAEYLRHGGILPLVLRRMIAAA